MNADKRNLTPQILSELKSLFPVKPEAFEEEVRSPAPPIYTSVQ